MRKVELVIKNGDVYCSFLQKFYKADIALEGGKILYVGEMPPSIEAEAELDASGLSIVPGLIDIHMHVESSMITPEAFSWGTIKHGVTTVVAEPHEMGNVAGIEGIRAMIDAAEGLETDFFYGISSSIPCTRFETTGGAIGVEETKELLNNPQVICVGEVMNFKEVTQNPESPVNQLIKTAREVSPKIPIEAHCPALMGYDLARMMFAGLDGDHTEQTPERLMERMRLGMLTELQHKSLAEEVLSLVRQNRLEHHVCLVTDDSMPDTFLRDGHLDHVLRSAIKNGLEPEQAIFMSTWTPANRMQLTDRGAISPGKSADMVFLSDVKSFKIHSVMKNGKIVYEENKPYPEPEMKKNSAFPAPLWHSVKLAPLTENDFMPRVETGSACAKLRLMILKDKTTMAEEGEIELPIDEKTKTPLFEGKAAMCAVFERYGKNGNRAHGFMDGCVIKRGAVATTLAHDHHNLLVVGANVKDMLIAANRVIELNGGYVTAEGGRITAEAPLPIGGILSDKPLSETAKKLRDVRKALELQGYDHYSPLMSLSTIGLSVSPHLRITDMGLLRVKSGTIVSMVVDEGDAQ